MDPDSRYLYHLRHIRIQMEYNGQLHCGYGFVGNYDLGCAPTTESDATMEHAVFPRRVLDSCRHHGKAADYRMSFLFSIV